MEEEVLHDRIVVRDGAGRAIHLRLKINWGIRQRLRGASLHGVGVEDKEVELNVGDWNLTLLSLMTLEWSGPDFSKKTPSVQTIMDLPESCDDILDRAVAAIGRANPPKRPELDDPKGEIIDVSPVSTSDGEQP
jgi:hypothetical protein